MRALAGLSLEKFGRDIVYIKKEIFTLNIIALDKK